MASTASSGASSRETTTSARGSVVAVAGGSVVVELPVFGGSVVGEIDVVDAAVVVVPASSPEQAPATRLRATRREVRMRRLVMTVRGYGRRRP